MSKRERINAEIIKCELELDTLLGAMLRAPKPANANQIRFRLAKVAKACDVMKLDKSHPALSVFAMAVGELMSALPRIDEKAVRLSDDECAAFEKAETTLSASLDALLGVYSGDKELTKTITAVKAVVGDFMKARHHPTAELDGMLKSMGSIVETANYASVPEYRAVLVAIGLALHLNRGVAGITI